MVTYLAGARCTQTGGKYTMGSGKSSVGGQRNFANELANPWTTKLPFLCSFSQSISTSSMGWILRGNTTSRVEGSSKAQGGGLGKTVPHVQGQNCSAPSIWIVLLGAFWTVHNKLHSPPSPHSKESISFYTSTFLLTNPYTSLACRKAWHFWYTGEWCTAMKKSGINNCANTVSK